MSESKYTPVDAEFLSKRLGRVCTRLGLTQPFGDNHESNAQVAGTTLAAVDRAVESLVKQRDELLAALDVALENIRPHGDNCFVSDHYEGDPGAGCNCGIDGVIDYLISTIASVKEKK